MAITQIIKEKNNIILKDALDDILAIIDADDINLYPSDISNNVVYITDKSTNRTTSSETLPIILSNITEPAGTWTQTSFMQWFSDNITTRKSYDVYVQDQYTDRLSLFLGELLDTVTILSPINKDVENISIETTGYVPIVGNHICLQENNKISQEEIVSVTPISGNQYTVKMAVPSDYAYTTAGGCSIQNVNMAVDGSVTPRSFGVAPRNNKWDVTRMLVSMVVSSQPDDAKFGDLLPLTNGVFFRKEDSQNSQNLFNAKDNSDFAIEGYDITYAQRSLPTSQWGLRCRISFNGTDKSGVVIRLDSETGDGFRAIVRDNLSGLVRFRVKIQGHIVLD